MIKKSNKPRPVVKNLARIYQLEVDQLESGDVDNVETPVGDTVPEAPSFIS